MGISGSQNGGTVSYKAIVFGDIPLHSPYIGRIYGRYLQSSSVPELGRGFNSYVGHYQRVNPSKIPLNYGFPMVFLWFSYGIAME